MTTEQDILNMYLNFVITLFQLLASTKSKIRAFHTNIVANMAKTVLVFTKIGQLHITQPAQGELIIYSLAGNLSIVYVSAKNQSTRQTYEKDKSGPLRLSVLLPLPPPSSHH